MAEKSIIKIGIFQQSKNLTIQKSNNPTIRLLKTRQ